MVHLVVIYSIATLNAVVIASVATILSVSSITYYEFMMAHVVETGICIITKI